MARSIRTTRGNLGNPRGTLNKQAERLLRRNEAADKAASKAAATRTAVARLDRNETGEFLVSAFAAERNPDLGISVPKFPITAHQVLENMDGFVAVPDPVWKGRSVQYKVPHPGIVFLGVVNAKGEAVNKMVVNHSGDDFEQIRAKVRAGQILMDYLRFLEGKSGQEFHLGSVYVAGDLITEFCFAAAADQGVTMEGLRVRPNAQFTYDELAEKLGESIPVSAFGGAVEYFYRVPHSHTIVNVVRSMVLMMEGKASQLDEEVAKHLVWFANMYGALPDDEKRLVRYSATDVLDDLQTMVDMEKARATLAGGNGHADVGEVAEAAAVETA